MQYTYDAKAFGNDLAAFLKAIDCSYRTAAKATGLSTAPVRAALKGMNIHGSSMAILCYWADLDIRKYVKDEVGQNASRTYQKSLPL